MTIRTDFLTVRRPDSEPTTTRHVERSWKDRSRGWKYDAVFEEMPPALAAPAARAGLDRTHAEQSPLIIEGEFQGTGFQIARPKAVYSVPIGGDDPVEVGFTPTPSGYQRYGSMENRDGTWTELATTGIADPADVRRVSTTPVGDVDWEWTAKSRAAHYWAPTSADFEGITAQYDLTCLISILPEDTPPSVIAALAAPHLELDHHEIQEAISSLRNQLRVGHSCGQEVMLADRTIWHHMPDWGASHHVSKRP